MGEGNGKGKPSRLTHASLFNRGDGRIRHGGSKSTAFNAVDAAVSISWAPRSRELARMRSNCGRAVIEEAQARCSRRPVALWPPAPFHLPDNIASKGAPSLHASGHDTHYSTTRALRQKL